MRVHPNDRHDGRKMLYGQVCSPESRNYDTWHYASTRNVCCLSGFASGPVRGGLVVNRIVGPNETITADRVKDGAQSIDPGQEAALH
jgi:hypothetical protein